MMLVLYFLQDFCSACCVGLDSYGTSVRSAVAAVVDDALTLVTSLFLFLALWIVGTDPEILY